VAFAITITRIVCLLVWSRPLVARLIDTTNEPAGNRHRSATSTAEAEDLAQEARGGYPVRDPSPFDLTLDAFRHEDTPPLPYLAPAVSRFLQEYSWTDTEGRAQLWRWDDARQRAVVAGGKSGESKAEVR
jgi:hypothetical protein